MNKIYKFVNDHSHSFGAHQQNDVAERESIICDGPIIKIRDLYCEAFGVVWCVYVCVCVCMYPCIACICIWYALWMCVYVCVCVCVLYGVCMYP